MNKKDLKKFKTMLEESKKQLLLSARKTLTEESSFDTDDLPDEIDLASSEYSQSMIFRLRDREKFLLAKIDKALARIENGTFVRLTGPAELGPGDDLLVGGQLLRVEG